MTKRDAVDDFVGKSAPVSAYASASASASCVLCLHLRRRSRSLFRLRLRLRCRAVSAFVFVSVSAFVFVFRSAYILPAPMDTACYTRGATKLLVQLDVLCNVAV